MIFKIIINFILLLLKKKVGAIYDLNVGIEYKNNIRPDLNSIRNGLPLNGEILVRRIPMSEVPTDDEESAQFIHKLYQEKDEIYDVYARTGSFASLGVKRIDLRVNYYDLYIAIAWIILCTSPIIYYLGALLSNATLFVNLIIIASFFIGNYYFLIIFKIICFFNFH